MFYFFRPLLPSTPGAEEREFRARREYTVALGGKGRGAVQ